MTYEEALNSLMTTYSMIRNDDYVDGDAFKCAQAALKKQIGQKPKEVICFYGVHHYCPACAANLTLRHNFPSYCPECGQRIDWKWN